MAKAAVGTLIYVETPCSYTTISGCMSPSCRHELARATKVSREGIVKRFAYLRDNFDRAVETRSSVMTICSVDCLLVADKLAAEGMDGRDFADKAEVVAFVSPLREASTYAAQASR